MKSGVIISEKQKNRRRTSPMKARAAKAARDPSMAASVRWTICRNRQNRIVSSSEGNPCSYSMHWMCIYFYVYKHMYWNIYIDILQTYGHIIQMGKYKYRVCIIYVHANITQTHHNMVTSWTEKDRLYKSLHQISTCVCVFYIHTELCKGKLLRNNTVGIHFGCICVCACTVCMAYKEL